jgi:Chaperone of endosialidase
MKTYLKKFVLDQVTLIFALACFALSPTARAVLPPPPPDGGYPGGNTAEGTNALFNLTTGTQNTAIGFQALNNTTTGSYNTAIGWEALFSITTSNDTTGYGNTAVGVRALYSNTTGRDNTAIGTNTLFSNTTGFFNTATSQGALGNNNTGNNNTADGHDALGLNTTGNENTATGSFALVNNTMGNDNTADGFQALGNNTTGVRNTANGVSALLSNTIGNSNTADGYQALFHNTGSNNIGLGINAGSALTTGSGNVCIGVAGVAGESNTTRIRNVYSSVVTGRAVYVNSTNKIGTLVSSRRYKEKITPMDKASEALLALKPVTFHYKKEIEPNGTIMFGLIAEEVEKVHPDLVTRNEKGEAETVRYEAVNAMLLNEFLKEHRKVDEQQTTIAQLKRDSAEQRKQIELLTAGLQKVSAQIEMSNPAPRVVENR